MRSRKSTTRDHHRAARTPMAAQPPRRMTLGSRARLTYDQYPEAEHDAGRPARLANAVVPTSSNAAGRPATGTVGFAVARRSSHEATLRT